jgi:pyrroloquinoline quinone (PQQ) biosynthesis protein C
MDASIQKRLDEGLDHVRQHPFVVHAMSDGLPQETAMRWIFCASRSFPDVLRGIISRTAHPQVRITLQENLDDELGNGNPEEAHFVHYLSLLHRLGVDSSDFDAYEERSGIKLALGLAHSVAAKASDGVQLGYMLINEGITPITYRAAQQALLAHYPHMNRQFFDIHVDVDDMHLAHLQQLVPILARTDRDGLLFGIDLGERGMLALLDEAYGVLAE